MTYENEAGNTKTVYVVQVDNKKDLSDAKKYGGLRAVFANPRKPYDTDELLTHARRVLSEWVTGDYLLILGDPTLCAVCMAVVAEEHDTINLLSWDRDTYKYLLQHWDFNSGGNSYDDDDEFITAE